MSYARWSKDSDIYFYCCDATPNKPIFECASCCLTKVYPTFIHGVENAIEHIEAHIKAGDLVEPDVIPLLRESWGKQ